jgi:glycosyltransferase involved in cell wall biosynthesis
MRTPVAAAPNAGFEPTDVPSEPAVDRRYVAINNYSIAGSQRGVQDGVLPRHHLYGIDQLVARGSSAIAVDGSQSGLARIVQRAVPSRFGPFLDPLQLAETLTLAHRSHATVYAMTAYCFGTHPLTRRGSLRVVAVVHGALEEPYTSRLARALDGAICLNEISADRLTSAGCPAVTIAAWGPDLTFAPYCEPRHDGEFTVAALGTADRDLDLLLRVLAAEDIVGVVAASAPTSLPDRVRSLQSVAAAAGVPDFDANSYARPASVWPSVDVFAIPLIRSSPNPTGLTEVNDALALGRPIVMTRTPGLGFDIEGEGLGIWIDPGDSDGWRRALALLRDDASVRTEMGANARRFAETRWNNHRFSQDIQRFLTRHDL